MRLHALQEAARLRDELRELSTSPAEEAQPQALDI